jgi:hypothetical protein
VIAIRCHLQVTRGRQLQRQTCSRSKAARGSQQVSGHRPTAGAHSAKSSKLDTSIKSAWRALNAAQHPMCEQRNAPDHEHSVP